MEEVLELSDRIYVMKDGAVVDVVLHDQADKDKTFSTRWSAAMSTRSITASKSKNPMTKMPFWPVSTAFRMRGVLGTSPSNFTQGEVLCLVGTEGSGREAVLRRCSVWTPRHPER